jgi:uncharacterized membrane protein YkgB
MLYSASRKEDDMTSFGSANTNIGESAATRDTASHSPVLFLEERHLRLIEVAGMGLLRYGLVFLLLLIGSFKFFAFEAEAIQPLVANSPFLSWLYPIFGLQGTSSLIGVIEVTTAVLIATRPRFPRVSGYASLVGSLTFVITLSFLFTTPGMLAAMNPGFQFVIKDIVLLGAALVTSAEALRAAGGRSA